MMEWAAPWWLVLLPLVLWLPWRGGQPGLRWPDLRGVSGAPSLRLALAPLVPLSLALGMAALLVGLARPQEIEVTRYVEHEGIDIMLVLDTSGSMEAQDYSLGGRNVNRLEVAKAVIADFVQGRPNDRIGLVVFGEEAFTQVPLTMDHDALVGILSQVQLGVAGGRATAVGDAIAVAGARLKDLDAPTRLMILLTDGANNAGSVAPLEAAQAAKSLGIKVYTVGIGAQGGGRMGIFGRRGADLDEATLKAIASTTDARYFLAENTQALREVYETIDRLETSKAEVEEEIHAEERFAPWIVAGLALLVAHLLLGETVLRRLP